MSMKMLANMAVVNITTHIVNETNLVLSSKELKILLILSQNEMDPGLMDLSVLI